MMRSIPVPLTTMALLGTLLLYAAPAPAAESCADQIAATKAAAEAQPDAKRKEKALQIIKDAESDNANGNEAFCLDEVAAARKALGM